MKFFALTVVSFLLSVNAFGAIKGSPFQPETDKRFHELETSVTSLQNLPSNANYAADGISNIRVARVTYDVAEHGGGIGAHGLGVSLPAKAMVKQVWFYTVTQFSDSGTGTVALSCEDAGNLFNATDITGNAAGSKVSGVATGTAANMIVGIAAACEITATVADAAQATGKINIFVEYVVTD